VQNRVLEEALIKPLTPHDLGGTEHLPPDMRPRPAAGGPPVDSAARALKTV
jgi:hypothetical protein